MYRLWLVIMILVLMGGCQSNSQKTLADIRYSKEKEPEAKVEAMTRADVRKEYQSLLDLFEDSSLKEQIERRVADVYMLEGGDEQLKNINKKSYYADAIKSYREILDKYPNSPDNADVLYHLARAYDLEGRQDEAMKMLVQLTEKHPTYKNIAEAHFRKGDIYFSAHKYRLAQKEYVTVINLNASDLIIYAHYMLGWANYKQSFYESALKAFAYVLEQLNIKESANVELSNVEKPLIKDALNSISLAFSKYDGSKSIDQFDELQNKPFTWRVYDHLGEFYLKKERFEDSANTYRRYVAKYHSTAQAPILHGKLIQAYIEGGFPLLALKEKESYVGFYGIGSDYSRARGVISQEVYDYLHLYINELATYYHAKGQAALDLLAEQKQSKNSLPKKKRENIHQESMASFLLAAEYYQRFIDTFPDDPTIGKQTYLMAETLFSAMKFGDAAKTYEKVAYVIPFEQFNEYGAKAGYAAIIAYQKQIEWVKEDKVKADEWQNQAVASMLKFAEVFHNDKRAPSVLTNAAEYLFGLNKYHRAIDVAGKIINSNAELDGQLKKTAYGILAHSYFQIKNYQNAEVNYLAQRQLVRAKSDEYRSLSEQIAISIYKQADEKRTSNQLAESAQHLLRIKSLAPASTIRVASQFEAAGLLMTLNHWGKAIAELEQINTQFLDHELIPMVKRKLSLAYDKNKQWNKAAEHYLMLSKNDNDENVRRDALYQAALMRENGREYESAIALFKQYARRYEQPFNVRMEARFHLATLYQLTNDPSKKLFWLRRIIDGDKKAGKDRNDRSQWLAAWANIEYGDYFNGEFKKIKLKLMSPKRMAKKNKALEDAIARYQKAADYGHLEFITESSFKIADIYLLYAKELRASPIPNSFSKEDVIAFKSIIEQQAGPLEALSMELYLGNVERAWSGEYNQWIEKSFSRMRELNPSRFAKSEVRASYGNEIL